MCPKDAFSENDSSIFDNINVGIYRNTPGPKGRFIKVNTALVKIFGYASKKEVLKLHVANLYLDHEERRKLSDTILKNGFVRHREIILKKKNGTVFPAQITAICVKNKKGQIEYFDGIIEDISDTKEEEGRLKLIYEHTPVGIWEEDLSCLVQLLKKLKKAGIRDIRRYLLDHSKVVVETFRKVRILDVNKAGFMLYGARDKKELIKNFGKTFTRGIVNTLIEEFIVLASGEKFFETEFKSKTLGGKLRDVLLRVSVPDGYEKTLSRVIVTIQDITDRKDLERYLKRVAQEDGLTKLLNSRAMSKRLEEELIRARRYNLDLSCLMLDVDRFKRINDKFGHQAGDQVLKRIAFLIKKSVRRSDIVGRYGGDEFFVILTETKPDNAAIAAERIRQLVSTMQFKFAGNMTLKITISIGISGYPSRGIEDYRDLIVKADKALYAAKAAGRNCIKIS